MPKGGNTPQEFARNTEAYFNAKKQAGENTRQAHNDRGNFHDAVERAGDRHKEIPQEVFAAIESAYAEREASFNQRMAAIHRSGPNGAPAHPGFVRREEQKLRQETYDSIHRQITTRFGEKGHKAWDAVSYELQPDSIFTPVIRQVYNTDKGGFQIGGALGGLLGGAAALFMTGGGGGGILGILSILLFAGMGAWAGNKATDMLANTGPGSNAPTFPGAEVPTRAEAPQKTRSPKRAPSTESLNPGYNQASPGYDPNAPFGPSSEYGAPQTDVTNGDLGNLSPSAPKATLKPPASRKGIKPSAPLVP